MNAVKNFFVSRHRPTVAVIDLAKIAENFRLLKSAVSPNAFVCPMVKANAYGHGDAAVAMKLRDVGAKHLGVALIEEGLGLRSGGDHGSILQFGFFDSFGAEAMIQNKITPMISSLEALDTWIHAVKSEEKAGRVQTPVAVHLKVNTGMNRLGVALDGVGAVAKKLAASRSLVRLEGLATHLSDGDDFVVEGGHSENQLERFRKAEREVREAGLSDFKCHLANSSATRALKQIGAGDSRYEDLGSRPGIALYGVEPDAEKVAAVGVQPALRWLSRLMHIQDVRQGEGVSYGGRWVAPRNSRVGVIPCGYADGYRRAFNSRGKAEVIVGGRRVPVVGTVCMDYFMCDLTDVQNPQIGDIVTLIGSVDLPRENGQNQSLSVTAVELAGLADTISYEVFTGLSERVPRLYVDDGAPVGVTSIQ